MSTVYALFTGFLIQTQAEPLIENIDIIEGSNIFGYELSNQLYDPASNLWVSPFCITSCFSLVYPGCGLDSTTQLEIADVMGFPSTSDPADVTQQFFTLQGSIDSTYTGEGPRNSIIGIANKIYASNLITLKQSYITALYDTIRQESFIDESFDFSSENASTIINNWVSENTNDLIDSIVAPGTDMSGYRLLALNAIYLNGSFASPFQTWMTSAQKFYTDVTRTTEASDIHLMHQQGNFMYYQDANYQFLKFPFSDIYNSKDLFILYALPKVAGVSIGDRPGLRTDNEYINWVIGNLTSQYIALALPKLDIAEKYEDDLIAALQTLGINDAFIDGVADFSGLTEQDIDLVITKVIHKTMVRMDEEGLVAAAVTAIGVGVTSINPFTPEPILFKADHPFQMFIIDGEHDNTVLFMGQIMDPGIPEGSETPTYVETDTPWNNFVDYTKTQAPGPDTTIPGDIASTDGEGGEVTYIACTQECKLCPDGTCEPKDENCEYTIGCPDIEISTTDEAVKPTILCTEECRLCPDDTCEPKDENCEYTIGCPGVANVSSTETGPTDGGCQAIALCIPCPGGSCQKRDANCELIPCAGACGLYVNVITIMVVIGTCLLSMF